jgi:Zn-finger nucleic acid-binding protein
VCRGVWTDAGSLDAILRSDSGNPGFRDLDREEWIARAPACRGLDLALRRGRCPLCKEDLFREADRDRPGVFRECCPNGHGIWLDGGVILELRRWGFVRLVENAGRLSRELIEGLIARFRGL